MKKVIIALMPILLFSCTTVQIPKFVNVFEPEMYRQYRTEKIKILSLAGDLFKVYSLSDDRIAIIAPYNVQFDSSNSTASRSTSTVDIIDLNRSIILNSDQHIELKKHLQNIINVLDESYIKGMGTLYDYSIYYETKELEKNALQQISEVTKKNEVCRIQLRLDDKDTKSNDPYIKITVKLLDYLGEVKTNDIKALLSAL